LSHLDGIMLCHWLALLLPVLVFLLGNPHQTVLQASEFYPTHQQSSSAYQLGGRDTVSAEARSASGHSMARFGYCLHGGPLGVELVPQPPRGVLRGLLPASPPPRRPVYPSLAIVRQRTSSWAHASWQRRNGAVGSSGRQWATKEVEKEVASLRHHEPWNGTHTKREGNDERLNIYSCTGHYFGIGSTSVSIFSEETKLTHTTIPTREIIVKM
jgi:hypothetical protein